MRRVRAFLRSWRVELLFALFCIAVVTAAVAWLAAQGLKPVR
jgi:hypothetical protein